MNTMTMERPSQIEYATIMVAYLNEKKTGQRNASIKDADGLYYWVKPEELQNYRRGASYNISFATTQSNGYTNRTIKSAELAQPVAVPQQPQPSAPPRSQPARQPAPTQRSAPVNAHVDPPPPNHNGEFNRQTHPEDARRMWVCSQMNALIQSHQLIVGTDPVPVTDTIDMLARAYDQSVLGRG